MSRKSKTRARIWNRYICPAIEWLGYGVCALAAIAGFYACVVALILLVG